MKVIREGTEFEAAAFDGDFKLAPRRLQAAVCTTAHYGSNWPHVHSILGLHILAEGDYILQAGPRNGYVVLDPEAFASECAPAQEVAP